MTVNLVISLPKIPHIHRKYIWFWPTLRNSILHSVKKKNANNITPAVRTAFRHTEIKKK